MTRKTLYDVLQVSRNAEPETIKAAYKSLVQRYHPDKNPDDPDAENHLKNINHAYEVLSDAAKRAGYDATLMEDDDAATSGDESKQSQTAHGNSSDGFSSSAAPVDNKPPIFLYIPLTRLIFLSFASYGMYQAYWIYKNWLYIKERDGLNIRPFWRGIFGIFFCHSLMRRVHDDKEARSIQFPAFSPTLLGTVWIILSILLNSWSYHANGPIGVHVILALFGVLPALCLVPVQKYINVVTEKRNPRQLFYGWSSGHIVVLVVSALVWLMLFEQGDTKQRVAASQNQSQNPFSDPNFGANSGQAKQSSKLLSDEEVFGKPVNPSGRGFDPDAYLAKYGKPVTPSMQQNTGTSLQTTENEKAQIQAQEASTRINKMFEAKNYEGIVQEYASGKKVFISDLNQIGVAMYATHRYGLAANVFLEAEMSYPKDSVIKSNLGDAYLSAGDADNALKKFREALALDPQNARARLILKRADAYERR